MELRFDTPARKLSIISCYFPSGSSGEERQQAKFRFLDEFDPHLARLKQRARVHPVRRRQHRPQGAGPEELAQQPKNSGFLPEERAWMTKLLERDRAGRRLPRACSPTPPTTAYTWWSNRGQAYLNNVGWRLDYHLATPALAQLARNEAIYKTERFSDHAPITVEYEWAL